MVGEVEFSEYDGINTEEDKLDWKTSISDETGSARLILGHENQIPPLYNDKEVFDADEIKVASASTSEYQGALQLTIDEDTDVERVNVGLLDSPVSYSF